MKKGEIKITVIATSFDEESIKKKAEHTIDAVQSLSDISHPEPPKVKKKPISRPTVIPVKETVKEKPKETKPEAETDDEWDIPAFIRRKIGR